MVVALLELGLLALDGRLASLRAFFLLLAKADLLRELVPQALQLVLQLLAATTDFNHLPQGCVSSSLCLKDGLPLSIAGRRGLNQRRTNRGVGANPSRSQLQAPGHQA